jgi:hypothetical protein
MAITIRNKQTEAMIREIGRRTGEGPSQLLARLARAELAEMEAEERKAAERRLAAWEELDREFPPPSDEEKEAISREMERMYDYLDEDVLQDGEEHSASEVKRKTS